MRDISFVVEPGQLIGVVGPTGAGKSSLMSLLTRFYEPQAGTIEIDGVPIAAMRQRDVHAMVGIVQQDVSLFTVRCGTIFVCFALRSAMKKSSGLRGRWGRIA
ncbi:ATP-binding cassette domain-containing protein [Alicyclobacillus sacchari]|uniref:ATP-binding cassette domain-containing protein n=1 Tax=Alicyclobacillus sacchari TaxID=392010 RepID=UPI0024E137A3|nr:ATP-binding cassette domain-containing protein [Alicyclobacillus sacchari]